MKDSPASDEYSPKARGSGRSRRVKAVKASSSPRKKTIAKVSKVTPKEEKKVEVKKIKKEDTGMLTSIGNYIAGFFGL
jgi:hypothetical protein